MNHHWHNSVRNINSAMNVQNIEELSEALGALTHYIQDLANPSHVLPIYHDPSNKDGFDEYPLPIIASLGTELCEEVDRAYASLLAEPEETLSTNTLGRIDQQVANLTLNNLKSGYSGVIGKDKFDGTWEDFWYPCDANECNEDQCKDKEKTAYKRARRAFCEYDNSYLGNNFGRSPIVASPKKCGQMEGIKSCNEKAHCVVNIHHSEYDHFAKEQTTLAMTYTLVALRIVSDILIKCPVEEKELSKKSVSLYCQKNSAMPARTR